MIRRVLFFIFVLSVATIKAQAVQQDELRPLDLLQNKPPTTTASTETAINEYQNSVDPNSFGAQHKLGVVYATKRDYRTAIPFFIRASQLKPSDTVNLDYLAFACFMAHEPQQAKLHYQQLIAMTPKSATAHSNLGFTHLSLKEYAAAETAFQEALAIEPSNQAATAGLCFGYVADDEADNNTAAMDVCTKAVYLDPASPQANYLLGYAYLFSGRNAESLPWFKKAQELEPDNPLVHIALGRAELVTQLYADAAVNFARAAEIAPQMLDAYMGLGVAHFRMKHLAQATSYFNRALQINPASESARFNLGVVCLLRQERECVLQQYNALKIGDSALADKLFRGLFRDRILDVRKQ